MPVTDWKPARFVVSTTGFCNYDTVTDPVYTNTALGKVWNTGSSEHPQNAAGYRKIFDGSTSYLLAASDSGNFDTSLNASGLTIGAWVAPKSMGNSVTAPIFYRGGNGGVWDRVAFGAVNGTIYGVIDDTSGEHYGYTSPPPEWQGIRFLCMVYDGSKTGNSNRLKVYTVNQLGDVKENTLTFHPSNIPDIAPAADPLSDKARVGLWETQYLNGMMGHLQVYNRPMSSGEVQSIALHPASTSGLIAYYKMDQPNDEVDVSGSGNHLHNIGTTWRYSQNALYAKVNFATLPSNVGVASKWIEGFDFDLNVPSGYQVVGIDTRIKLDVSATGTGGHMQNVMRLADYVRVGWSGSYDSISSTVSGDYLMMSVHPSSDPSVSYRSYEQVNRTNFGFAYAIRTSGDTVVANRIFGIDSMEMRAWYSTPNSGLPLYVAGAEANNNNLPLYVFVPSGITGQGMNLFLDSHPFSSSAGLNQGVKAPTSKIRCFDGVDDYGYIPSGSALNSTDKLTVATWFYSSGPSAFPVFAKGEQGAGTTWYKYNDSTNNRLAGYMGTGNFSFPNGGLLQSGWNFAAVVYDGTAAQALRLKSYINGAESTASEGIPAAIPTHTDDVQIVKGRVGDPPDTEIGNTRLSHYHIYTGVLSAAQIEQVRTEPLSYTTNLWAYYKMIGTGTWEHDYSNNGRHLQISGASSCNLSEVNYNLGMPGAIFEQFNIMPMYLTAVTGIDGFRAATGMNMYVQVANPTGWLSMPLHTYSAHLATGGMPLVIPSSIGQSTKGVTLFSAGY